MNPLIDDGSTPRALLALEDGSVFEGLSCGAAGETFGEVVFNTSMVGYQEIVSDPSYAGQIVTLTYPQVGNYGVCEEVMQSPELYLRGLVVRDMCRTPNNWTSTGSLPELLSNHGVVAIEGVDTRALTLTIRDKGAMRAAISTVDLDPESLVARVRASERISEHNFVPDVSRKEIVTLPAQGERRFRVVAFDCGVKQGILDGLTSRGCEVTVVPWDTPAEKVLEMDPDGVFFSNGPGDPEQVGPTAAAARAIIGKKPVFGICLGNQLISIAAGSEIEKLPYGHHGLVFKTMGELVPELSGGVTEHFDDMREWSRRGIAPVVMTKELGRVRLTHVNLNDGTPEGIQFLDAPTFSVQYHPEACPGPHDSAYLFEAFCRLMEGKEDYLAIDVREGRRF